MKKFYILYIVLLFFFCDVNSSYAAGAADIGGAINTHDMMMLKEQQRLMQQREDFKNLKERQEDPEKEKDIIECDPKTGEKIFNAETAKIIEVKNIEKAKDAEKKRKFFFKKKQKQETIEPKAEKTEIEKSETSTTISARAEKTKIHDDKVLINSVSITNSYILSDIELQQLINPIIGKEISFEELAKVIEDINYIYATKGYITARAFLPPQTIENNTVKIQLIEGRIGKVSITNNRWTTDSFIGKRLDVKSGDLFDIVGFEQDVVAFNKYNPGIALKANLTASEVENSTDIEVVAHESFPFHVTAIMDNAGRKTIGKLRGGLMLSADSLFGQRDRLTLGSYASRNSVTPFADYNIPVNKYDGRVGFLFSSGYSEIGSGPYSIFDIKSRSYNYSLYYTHPLIRKPYFELSAYTAANYKTASTSFDDVELQRDKVTSFEASLNARYDTARGIWYLTQGVYQAFPIFDENSKYFKYTGSVVRLHDFGHGIIGQFRGMYQFSPNDVIPYLDQFQAGGLSSVRGYSEGLLIGRSGYILSAELMFPIAPQTLKIKNKKKDEVKTIPFLGSYVKGIVFFDHAGVMPYKGEGPGTLNINSDDYLTSIGFGLRISLPGDINCRLYWGYPLTSTIHENDRYTPRLGFELSLTPDFDKILALRKPRPDKVEKEKKQKEKAPEAEVL